MANSIGIVLSSDSTVSFGNSGKFYPTVNKIFSLSGRQPVGIMISGGAISATSGLHWERIIGLFRNEIDNKEQDHLRGYYDIFNYVVGNVNTPAANNNSIKSDLINFFTERVFTSVSKKQRLANEFRGEVEYHVPEVTDYFDSSTEQILEEYFEIAMNEIPKYSQEDIKLNQVDEVKKKWYDAIVENNLTNICLLYTSPSPRDGLLSRMPSSA